jgi:hypothetical protein
MTDIPRYAKNIKASNAIERPSSLLPSLSLDRRFPVQLFRIELGTISVPRTLASSPLAACGFWPFSQKSRRSATQPG